MESNKLQTTGPVKTNYWPTLGFGIVIVLIAWAVFNLMHKCPEVESGPPIKEVPDLMDIDASAPEVQIIWHLVDLNNYHIRENHRLERELQTAEEKLREGKLPLLGGRND